MFMSTEKKNTRNDTLFGLHLLIKISLTIWIKKKYIVKTKISKIHSMKSKNKIAK